MTSTTRRLIYVLWCSAALALAAALAGCESGAPAGGSSPEAPPVATRIPRPTPTPAAVRGSPGRGQNAPLSGLVRVDVGDDWFLPEVVTITVGTTVRWYHVGEEAHNALAIDGSWGTNDFGIGGTAEQRFDKPGRYEYRCTRHAPGMSGIIVVVPR